MNYDDLRERYRPDKVRLLFVAESPPEGRFFYDVATSDHDSLYLEIMSVLFHNLVRGVRGERSEDITYRLRSNKSQYLDCFKRQGFWLQDAVSSPLPRDMNTRGKIYTIRRGVDRMIDLVRTYHPAGCVIIKQSVYDNLAAKIANAGIHVMNSRFIPFPGRGQQARFRRELGDLLTANGVLPLREC